MKLPASRGVLVKSCSHAESWPAKAFDAEKAYRICSCHPVSHSATCQAQAVEQPTCGRSNESGTKDGREQKKKQREEQLKLKAEEKARKTTEKAAEKAKRSLSMSVPSVTNRAKQVLPNQPVQNESSHHHHLNRRVKCYERKPKSVNVPLRP